MEQAAENGHADAQAAFAAMVRDGRGVRANAQEGLEWLRRSAEGGSHFGMCNYGIALVQGDDVEVDKAEGYRWLQKAADEGYEYAHEVLLSRKAIDRQFEEYGMTWFRGTGRRRGGKEEVVLMDPPGR